MRILHAGMQRSRMTRWCAGIYVTVTVVLTALFFVLNANFAEKTGINRFVYPEIEFAGVPLLADVSRDITLDFLDEHPGWPRRFFSIRWEGFWFVPEARTFTLHGAGDDRLEVWIDGELVIRRWPPADMHTEIRTVAMEAGVHELRVEYQQHGGARNLRFEWFSDGGLLQSVTPARFFHEWTEASSVELVRNVDRVGLAAFVLWVLLVLSGSVLLIREWLREWLEGGTREDVTAVIGLMAIALPVAIATGARYDYPSYQSHWSLILSGADPWTGNNSYGPAYNLLAGAFAFHPLLPKVIFVLGWLSCCSYLLRKLANSGVSILGLVVWSIALPFNPLFWIAVVVYGAVDALVGTCCILALAVLQTDRRATAGVMLGLATLLKFYPIVMAPFIAIHGRRIDIRFATGLVVTLATGLTLSFLAWGSSTLNPIVRATRRTSTMSIFSFLSGDASPLLGWTGNVDHLSVPAMALLGGIILILSWRWRLAPEAGAFLGVLAALSLYTRGSIQYFIVVPFLSAYWYARCRPSVRRNTPLVAALVACLAWLAFLAVLYELTRPIDVLYGMRGEWGFLRDWAGLLTFSTMVSLIATVMWYERREAHPTARAP